jgi:hypothetical protein
LPKDERQAKLAVLGLNVPGSAAQGAFSADYKRRRGRTFSVFGVTSAFVHSAKFLLLFPQTRELFLSPLRGSESTILKPTAGALVITHIFFI